MRRIKYILIFFICLLYLPISVSAKKYSITNYFVDVKVNSNNIYSITEQYNLLFIENSSFIRKINLRPKVYLSNDMFISYITTVDNINTEYDVTTNVNSKNYKITFPEMSEYTSNAMNLSYKYNMGSDLDNDHDIVFVNIVDENFETIPDSIKFSITLPCAVENQNINFYKNGHKLNDKDDVNYNLLGSHVEGTITTGLEDKDVLSIQIILPDGTFHNVTSTESNESYFLILLPLIMLSISAFGIKQYRREKIKRVNDPLKISRTFDSVEIAYLYKGKISVNDLLTAIIKLATDGYISLKNYGSKDDVSFKIKKEKEYDKDNAIQKIIFDGLFQNKEEVDIHDIEGVFYPYYIDARRTLDNKRNKKKLFYSFAKKLKIIILIGIYISSVLLQIKPLYNITDSHVVAVILSLITSAILTIAYHPKNKIIKYLLLLLTGMIIALEGYALIDFKLNFGLYCIGMILIESTLIIESLIPTRTVYGVQMYYEVDTLKKELAGMTDEIFEIKSKENQNYFFDMIPYLLVFDLTLWWFKKFGNKLATQPEWYQSSEVYNPEKLMEFINELIKQLIVPVQLNKLYADELLHQAPNKLL